MVANTRRSVPRDVAMAISIVLILLLAYLLIPQPTPSPSEIEGTWVHPGPGNTQTTLTFNSDGTFLIKQTPKQLFSAYEDTYGNEDLNWSDLVDLSGTWAVSDFRSSPG